MNIQVNSKHFNHKWSGFTFLEVLVSVIITGAVIAGTFSLFITAAGFIEDSGNKLEAEAFSQNLMEQLKMYVTADNTGQGSPLSSGIHQFSEIAEPPEGLSGNYEISMPYGSSGPSKITIRCNWAKK